MLLLPIVKMLASSCVTTTTVAPKLARRSGIKSASKRELMGASPGEGSSKKDFRIERHGTGQPGALLHAAADLGRIVVLETFQSDQGELQRCDLPDLVRV